LKFLGSDAEKCHKSCETLETGYTTLANLLTVYQKSGHGVKWKIQGFSVKSIGAQYPAFQKVFKESEHLKPEILIKNLIAYIHVDSIGFPPVPSSL